MIGQTIPHLAIFEKLDEGGIGVSCKAAAAKLERVIALKSLSASVVRGD